MSGRTRVNAEAADAGWRFVARRTVPNRWHGGGGARWVRTGGRVSGCTRVNAEAADAGWRFVARRTVPNRRHGGGGARWARTGDRVSGRMRVNAEAADAGWRFVARRTVPNRRHGGGDARWARTGGRVSGRMRNGVGTFGKRMEKTMPEEGGALSIEVKAERPGLRSRCAGTKQRLRMRAKAK